MLTAKYDLDKEPLITIVELHHSHIDKLKRLHHAEDFSHT